MPPAGDLSDDSQRFPEKLFRLLDRADLEGFNHVISWQPHGRSFIVHQREAFKELLPLLMPGMTLWKSFQRQLHLWGFTRFTEGRDFNSYFHEHFLRYRPRLLGHLRRIGNSARCKDNTKTMPDFYSMPFLTPLETIDRALTPVEVVASPWLGFRHESQTLPAHAGCIRTPDCSMDEGLLGHGDLSVGANHGSIAVLEGSIDQRLNQPRWPVFGHGSIETKDSFESSGDGTTWLGRELEPRPLPPVIALQGERALCSYTPVPVAQHPGFVQIGQESYSWAGAHATQQGPSREPPDQEPAR
jgi:HSF-type DNA-binding